MRHPPSLKNSELTHVLRDHFRLEVDTLAFLPLGEDGWTYRVDALDGKAWFAKLNQAAPSVSLEVTRHLCHALGLDWIPAPLPAKGGELYLEAGGLYVSVQPFVEGEILMSRAILPAEAGRIGAMLAQLHGCAQRLPENLRSRLPVENFARYQEMAARVIEAAHSSGWRGKTQRELASFIRDRLAVIEQVIEGAQALGRRARERKPRNVLCHADIHAANIIAAPDGRLWVIDWDGVMLAPPERDLFFWCDSPEWPQVSAGYGLKEDLDRELVRYYLMEWVVQEIADYGENVLFSTLSPEQKRDSLAEFITLFEPGNVVDAALNAER